jgi:hypothetical protein
VHAINSLTTNFGAARPNAKEKEVSWVKPLAGTFKLNIDASFHSDGACAARVILRDHKGKVL